MDDPILRNAARMRLGIPNFLRNFLSVKIYSMNMIIPSLQLVLISIGQKQLAAR